MIDFGLKNNERVIKRGENGKNQGSAVESCNGLIIIISIIMVKEETR